MFKKSDSLKHSWQYYQTFTVTDFTHYSLKISLKSNNKRNAKKKKHIFKTINTSLVIIFKGYDFCCCNSLFYRNNLPIRENIAIFCWLIFFYYFTHKFCFIFSYYYSPRWNWSCLRLYIFTRLMWVLFRDFNKYYFTECLSAPVFLFYYQKVEKICIELE